jgi:hypothetical protein
MKLVFKRDEVAVALGKTTEEFSKLQFMLETLGFPKPIRGLEDSWSIMDVINWVNTSKENTSQVA